MEDNLRRKAAALISYVVAEGSVWIKRNRYDEWIVNTAFADHEEDMYDHFRGSCRDVFNHDIGPCQAPGNGAQAIRGFVYSTLIAQWLVGNGVPIGEELSQEVHLPEWVMQTNHLHATECGLQPGCDEEGSVVCLNAKRPGLAVCQSRHTDSNFELALAVIDGTLRRDFSKRDAKRGTIEGTELYSLCRAMYRSEILEDVAVLFRRHGFRAYTDLGVMRLKEDGF